MNNLDFRLIAVHINSGWSLGLKALTAIILYFILKNGEDLYKIQWKDSWIPRERLENCHSLIESFFLEEVGFS